ncbi:hypothetical protein BJV74DRAFT_41249 [Russula compacta]|nr:hypothetical protein BJV74DRAFT_41249 [Russula compacta]
MDRLAAVQSVNLSNRVRTWTAPGVQVRFWVQWVGELGEPDVLGARQSVLTRSVRPSPLPSSFIFLTPTPSLLSNREWHGYTHGYLNPDPNPYLPLPVPSSTGTGSLWVTWVPGISLYPWVRTMQHETRLALAWANLPAHTFTFLPVRLTYTCLRLPVPACPRFPARARTPAPARLHPPAPARACPL